MDILKINEYLLSLARDEIMHGFAMKALAHIQQTDPASIIIRHDEGNTISRESLLDTYRFRQAQLSSNATSILGLDETILSLSRQSCAQVRLITVNLYENMIVLICDSNNAIIGGFLAKGSDPASQL